jgi:Gas vesicle synthesis protein GvpL/GvpF
MGSKAAGKEGKYLYAIVPVEEDREYGDIGIDGERVYVIADNQIGAVVSNFSNGKIRPERRHIAAHQSVLKRLMADETPLPITFGVIASGEREIKRILSLNRKSFAEQLRRVHGKVEMGLRVTWDVPNIFEYFVNTHAEIRSARDQFLGNNRVPTQEDKIEVGRLFDRVLQEDREEHTERVESILSPCCFESKRNLSRNEREVMNLACLVGRETVDKDFEAAVFEAARGFDNNFAFDFNGPWAPHHFVDGELRL